MLAPGPDHGILLAPSPDRGSLPAPAADEGVERFPHRPVFAVLLDLITTGVGTSSLEMVVVPWRHLDTAGVGTHSAEMLASTAISLTTTGVGQSQLTVVRTEIDLTTTGVGQSAFAITVAAVTDLVTTALGTADHAVNQAAIIALTTGGVGAAGFAHSVSTAITAAATGVGSAGFAVVPSATITLATAGTGTHDAIMFTGFTYTDDFNRASLGGDWVTVGSLSPVIGSSTHVQAGTGGGINATSPYVARYTSAVAGDNHRSLGTLAAPTGGSNFSLGTGVFVRGTTGGDRVEAVFTSTSVTIFTKTGGSGGTSTSRATQGSLTISTGSVIELVAVGNVYTAYVDGVSAVSWTDTGGVITIDSSHRSVGVTLFSHRNFSSTYTYGWALDDWIGRDG